MKILKRILVAIIMIFYFIGFFTIIPGVVYWIITGENYLDIPEDLTEWANE